MWVVLQELRGPHKLSSTKSSAIFHITLKEHVSLHLYCQTTIVQYVQLWNFAHRLIKHISAKCGTIVELILFVFVIIYRTWTGMRDSASSETSSLWLLSGPTSSWRQRAIQNWSDEWLVTFSAPKTKSMVVSRKRYAHLYPPLSFDNSVVDEVSNHKHLGIVLSNDLGWANHIDEICAKAMRRLDVIQSFKFKLDRNALERVYKSFVLPIMEYGDVVWAGSPDCDLEKLDKVHIRAMRIITGATEHSNINSMYEDLGRVSLSRRCLIHRLTLFYKITNYMTPQYLADIVPPTVGDRQIYNLRSRDNITQIHAQKQRYTKSFFPATIREWNSLPMEIRNSPTLCTFKAFPTSS